MRTEEQLIEYGKRIRERREKAREEIEKEKDGMYQYVPKINKRSEKIVKEK